MRNKVYFLVPTILVIFLFQGYVFPQDAFNLRSITAGVNIAQENYLEVLEKAKAFLDKGKDYL